MVSDQWVRNSIDLLKLIAFSIGCATRIKKRELNEHTRMPLYSEKQDLCQDLCQNLLKLLIIARFGGIKTNVQLVRDQEVVGSNPVISTILSNRGIFLRKNAFFCSFCR